MGKTKRALYIAFAALLAASCYPFNLSLNSTGSGLTNTAHVPDPLPVDIHLGDAYNKPYLITYYDDNGTIVTVNPDDSTPEATGETIKSITTTGEAGREILIGRPDADPINLNIQPDGSLAFRAADGDGFIPIGSYAEFQLINTEPGALADSYLQEADLDLMSEPWTPVGNDPDYFTGTFNGDGKYIENLYIDQPTGSLGLFGEVGGTVENVHVRSGSVTGTANVGGVAGALQTASSVVRLCSNAAEINGKGAHVGGVVGGCWGGEVNACYNLGTVTVTETGLYTGGVVGALIMGRTIACYNKGEVIGHYAVGGIVGVNNYGIIIACYNTGSVSGDDGSDGPNAGVGGVVGCMWTGTGALKACYNTGNVITNDVTDTYIGSVAGTGAVSLDSANYWKSGTAPKGIGGIDLDTSILFSDSAWPDAGTDAGQNPEWGIGASDGSGDGTYWKTLGSWNGGDPIYPKLWYEDDE
jgi:hypothetical protein